VSAPADSKLAKVKVVLQGGDEHDIETPLDIKASEFIDELVIALKLPRTDAEHNPIVWRMDNKDTGRTLEGEKSLADNGVREGHMLRLIRSVTAGA
jgi:uncharacterized ubiquitin-like protein YukD